MGFVDGAKAGTDLSVHAASRYEGFGGRVWRLGTERSVPVFADLRTS
jgi:hypothetical protein